MIDWILKRRSIRKYQDKDVPEEFLTDILKAAMAAPTANNHQKWEFVLVRDREVLKALAAAHPHGQMTAGAAAAIAVIVEAADKYQAETGAAATENILLAVSALGLGAVWLGMKDQLRQEAVGQIIGLPPGRVIAALIPVGYPAEEKPPRTQYDPKKVYRNRYGKY